MTYIAPIQTFHRMVARAMKPTWRTASRNMSIQKEVNMFARKTRENFVTLLISIVGMATAITWNEVVRYIIDVFFHERSLFMAKVSVAVIVTLVALVLTYMISRAKLTEPK